MTEPTQYHFTVVGTINTDGTIHYGIDTEAAYWPDGNVYHPNTEGYGWRTETEDDRETVFNLIMELERRLTPQT